MKQNRNEGFCDKMRTFPYSQILCQRFMVDSCVLFRRLKSEIIKSEEINANDNNKNQEALTDLFVPPWSSSTMILNTFYASRIKLVAHVKIIKICLPVCKPKLP